MNVLTSLIPRSANCIGVISCICQKPWSAKQNFCCDIATSGHVVIPERIEKIHDTVLTCAKYMGKKNDIAYLINQKYHKAQV